MHPLLTRFLISSAGATAATSVLVMTAENRDRDLRRPKKRKKKSTGKKKSASAKRSTQKTREAAVADPMQRARRELASGSEPLPFDAFFDNLKNTPRAVADVVSGKAAREKAEKKRRREEKRAKMTPAERRADDRRRAKKKRAKSRGEPEDWGIGASIRAEVKKQVKEAATETFRETAEAATDRFKDGADLVKEKTQNAAKRIAKSAPDVAASAKAVADGATKLTKAIADSVPESTEGAKKGLKSLGRWVEGPGAQAYDHDDDQKRLPGTSVVDAKPLNTAPKEDADTERAPNAPPEKPVDGRSIVQRRLEAARLAAERGSTTPRPSSERRVRPVRPADPHSGEHHDDEDDHDDNKREAS